MGRAWAITAARGPARHGMNNSRVVMGRAATGPCRAGSGRATHLASFAPRVDNEPGGACNCTTGLASPDPDTFLASATDYFADDAFATNYHSPPVTTTDLFTFGGSGLLTIGTLGIAAVAIPGDDDDEDYDVDIDIDTSDGTVDEAQDGAVTPSFTIPPTEASSVEKATAVVEAIAEKNDDITTEDDLMVVSAELEKVLGRNAASDVASARVSFAMGVDCPLQGFLFGSPVSSDAESRPEQREGGGRRTSLGELFMRTRFAEEKVTLVAFAESKDGGDGGGEREEGKAGKGSGGHKMMKKRKVKDEKGAAGNGVPASATVTKSKFQKILQIFHRKVYPDNHRSVGGGSTGDSDEPLASPKIRCRKDQRMPSFGCCTNRAFSTSPDSGELNGNKSGHWIKTDADYLVLEL